MGKINARSTSKQNLKTVIITGGGSGIGLALAKSLLESNHYRVVLVGRNREKLEHAATTLGGASDILSFFPCDLRDSKQIQKTVEKISGAYKGIYGLVNNAGVYTLGGLADTAETLWDETMAINVKAPFLIIQGVLETMSKSAGGGRIVNVASTAGILPNQNALAYSVSKAGLIHLSKTLAKELGKNNITVNCVCPGIVRTPLHDHYHATESELEEFYSKKGSSFPLGRVGEPEDVAAAVRYFLSEEARWVTGDVLTVDGGRLLI
jgi:NAD(P)-dependent dehydrogenase (short-subunit alcohol dehydrogenase family)